MTAGDDGPEEQQEQERARRRTSAQATARDLARMGIDPAALGLSPQTDAAAQEDGSGQHTGATALDAVEAVPAPLSGNVVPLRPESSLPPAVASPGAARWPAPAAGAGDPAGRSEAAGGALARLLGGEVPAAPTRATASQLARSITFGVLTPDAADAAEREREMVRRVRTRQAEQRLVVFVSGKGGVGTTTVATGVACVLAALRDDVTTLASVRPGAPSLGRLLGGDAAPSAREIARSDVDVAPLRLSNGLQVVDGPRWSTPVRRTDVPLIVDTLAESSAFTLLDVGNDVSDAAQSLLARADQVVVVSGPGPDNLDSARTAAERVADTDPYALDRAVYVVVCPRETGLKTVVRRMRETMPGGSRVVAMPPEPWLADGGPFDPMRVSFSGRLAMIDIAGLVALGATPGSA